MISLAGMMTQCSSRTTPSIAPPSPITALRSERSFMSIVRGQVMRRASRPVGFPCWSELSTIAASSACALDIAWKSPVKWRLMSSIGITCEYPPPAAPPFTPNTGPRLGSRMQSAAFVPTRRSACARPTLTVLLPSPAGVGLMAVTRTSRPLHRTLGDLQRNLRLVLAVEVEVVGAEPKVGSDFGDGTRTGGLCDVDIGRESRDALWMRVDVGRAAAKQADERDAGLVGDSHGEPGGT